MRSLAARSRANSCARAARGRRPGARPASRRVTRRRRAQPFHGDRAAGRSEQRDGGAADGDGAETTRTSTATRTRPSAARRRSHRDAHDVVRHDLRDAARRSIAPTSAPAIITASAAIAPCPATMNTSDATRLLRLVTRFLVTLAARKSPPVPIERHAEQQDADARAEIAAIERHRENHRHAVRPAMRVLALARLRMQALIFPAKANSTVANAISSGMK